MVEAQEGIWRGSVFDRWMCTFIKRYFSNKIVYKRVILTGKGRSSAGCGAWLWHFFCVDCHVFSWKYSSSVIMLWSVLIFLSQWTITSLSYLMRGGMIGCQWSIMVEFFHLLPFVAICAEKNRKLRRSREESKSIILAARTMTWI